MRISSILSRNLGMIAFTICIATTVEAREYFLATNGSDSHPGTRAKPWRSLQKSIWRLKAGDILTVRSGKYREASFADIQSPSKGKITTIRAEKGEKPIFDGRIPGKEAVEGTWSKLDGDQWISLIRQEWRRIDGLWLEGSYLPKVKSRNDIHPGSWYFDKSTRQALLALKGKQDPNQASLEFRLHSVLEVDTPFWLVQGLTAQYYNYSGFTISSTHHVTIRDCEAHYNGGSGIEADDSGHLVIENNHTSYNGAEGGPGWASGIHLWKTTSPNNFVRRNHSHHNWDPSAHHTDGNGIAVDRNGALGGAEVSDNIVHHNGGRGIDVTEVANVRLFRNSAYENSRDPLILNQGEVSVAEPISAVGFVMERNQLKAVGTNPPLVLFGAIDPKTLKGDENTFCNIDHPDLAVALYGGSAYSLPQWQQLSGTQPRSTAVCE